MFDEQHVLLCIMDNIHQYFSTRLNWSQILWNERSPFGSFHCVCLQDQLESIFGSCKSYSLTLLGDAWQQTFTYDILFSGLSFIFLRAVSNWLYIISLAIIVSGRFCFYSVFPIPPSTQSSYLPVKRRILPSSVQGETLIPWSIFGASSSLQASALLRSDSGRRD